MDIKAGMGIKTCSGLLITVGLEWGLTPLPRSKLARKETLVPRFYEREASSRDCREVGLFVCATHLREK